jgi:hypothetical protein
MIEWMKNRYLKLPHLHLQTVKIAYNEQMEKKRKERDEDKYGEYRKCDFIHGSAAEIEREWCAAEKVLSPASSPFQHPSNFA